MAALLTEKIDDSPAFNPPFNPQATLDRNGPEGFTPAWLEDRPPVLVLESSPGMNRLNGPAQRPYYYGLAQWRPSIRPNPAPLRRPWDSWHRRGSAAWLKSNRARRSRQYRPRPSDLPRRTSDLPRRTSDSPCRTSDSPLDFAERTLGVQLWEGQRRALEALHQHRRVAVKSGNGLGKGFCAAVAVLWFLYNHQPAIALSTAPTFRQVRHILWRQIHRLHRLARQPLGGTMLDTRWDLDAERYALGLSSDTADQFQGFHSPNMLVVVDEAAGVGDQIFEAVDSVLTSAETGRLLLIGNPTSVAGGFYNAFNRERGIYQPITISALDSPNVRAGRIVVPGLTTAEWVEERRRVWGEDSDLFRSRVLGEFPRQAQDALIPLSDIEAAVGKHGAVDVTPAGRLALPEPPEPAIMAVDVARYGADHSVILVRRGMRVEEIRAFQGLDTMTFTGRVAAAIRQWSPEAALVDEIGLGAGVLDRLKELGHPAQGVNVAKPPRQKGLYANLRAEGYFRLRELFAGGDILIPDDKDLIAELSSLRYNTRSDGRAIIESKDAMKKRGLPSPDRADALMLAFLEPAQPPKLWT